MNGRELTYIPKTITNNAVLVYVAALCMTNLLFSPYAMEWYFWLFGIVEVGMFFILGNYCSRKWAYISEPQFVKKLITVSLLIRIVWVLFSYWFYFHMTGEYFEFGAADVLYYDDAAKYGAFCLREGQWDFIAQINQYSGGKVAFSDSGYSAYLSVVYWLSNDSILFARIMKAVWSTLTVYLVYRFAQRNFGESTGRIAAILCMLMPNLVFYCGLHLKETEMVFLAVLFAERADNLLRRGKFAFGPTFFLILIAFVMFTIRTALAVTLVLALLVTLVLSTDKVVSWGKRILVIIFALGFMATMLFQNESIWGEVQALAQTDIRAQQANNMQWRSTRGGAGDAKQKFAKYAGAAVFAPMIFTIPFPSMTLTPNQENQRMIHGGNFCKNITSFFTIMALFMLLFSGDWRKYVLPISISCGYLVILVFSSFAHSERFHLPSVPFAMMFAAYAMAKFNTRPKYKRWFTYWLVAMFVAAIVWNWFKLAGRGFI